MTSVVQVGTGAWAEAKKYVPIGTLVLPAVPTELLSYVAASTPSRTKDSNMTGADHNRRSKTLPRIVVVDEAVVLEGAVEGTTVDKFVHDLELPR